MVLETIDFWTSAVNVSVDGNDITKTAPQDSFNAGAVSIASIPSGDGFAEFRVADATTSKAAGLSNGDGGQTRGDIDFGLFFAPDGGLHVVESGTIVTRIGSYVPQDVFRVRVENGVVSYLRNRVVFYTSAVAPTYPLLLDTSLRTPGTSILDARLVAGYTNDECALLDETLPGPGATSGSVVDAAGDVLLVGHYQATPPVAEVWRRSDSGWALEQTLVRPATPAGSSSFAYRLATDGETLAISLGGLSGNVGSVAIYRFDGAVWTLEDVVEGCDDDTYGLQAIDVQGDLVVAEGPANNRIYVFRRGGAGNWNLDGVLTSPLPENWGHNVAVGGDRVFVGAFERGPAGAVDVFRHNPSLPDPSEPPTCTNFSPGKWRHRAELLAADPHEFGLFDIEANRDGTRLLVGDPHIDVHLLELAGSVWTEAAVLEPTPWDFSGEDVDFGGPGPNEDSVVVTSDRDTYVYAELSDGWTQIDHIETSGDSAAAGESVFSLSGDDVRVYDLDPLCLAE